MFLGRFNQLHDLHKEQQSSISATTGATTTTHASIDITTVTDIETTTTIFTTESNSTNTDTATITNTDTFRANTGTTITTIFIDSGTTLNVQLLPPEPFAAAPCGSTAQRYSCGRSPGRCLCSFRVPPPPGWASVWRTRWRRR